MYVHYITSMGASTDPSRMSRWVLGSAAFDEGVGDQGEVERQAHVRRVQVHREDLADLAQPVAQRVAMDCELLRCLPLRSAFLEEHPERIEQDAAIVGPCQRADMHVAIALQQRCFPQFEQELERPERRGVVETDRSPR